MDALAKIYEPQMSKRRTSASQMEGDFDAFSSVSLFTYRSLPTEREDRDPTQPIQEIRNRSNRNVEGNLTLYLRNALTKS